MGTDGNVKTVHNAFTADELSKAAVSGGKLRMVTGHEYGAGMICRLLLFAAGMREEQTDLSYLEGRYFIDILDRLGAFSPETADDLSSRGLVNRNIMNGFLHSKRLGVTREGRYYIRKRGV